VSGIGVITNPRSRQNRRNPRLARQLSYILGERGTFQQPEDLDALAATARHFRERQIDVLCINGGDGTMHKAHTAMMEAYEGQALPKLAVLRGGTMNTIAHGLGIRGTPAQLLDFVVSRYHAHAPFATARRWMLEVDGRQYGFLFGNGLIARFLEAYYEGGDPSPKKAFLLLLRASASAAVMGPFIRKLTAPFVGRVELDGVAWPEKPWMTVGAGTVDDIGLGFRPFFLSSRHPGRMHAMGCGTTPFGLVKELPRIYRAREPLSEDIHNDVCSELVLRAEEPIGFMVDGDFHRGGQVVTIRVGPPVDFILPEL
jgi:diacylglycerol kinase family enzyme